MTFLPATSPTEILGPILCGAVVGLGLPALFTRSRGWRLAGLLLALLALAVPWNGQVSGLVMLLGGTNGLSAATLLMLGALALALLRGRAPGAFQSPGLAATVLVLALILYPATATLPDSDPYQWGYAGWILPAGLAVILLANLAGPRDPLLFAWIMLGCGGAALRLYETANLWDFLVDPAAAIGALLILAGRAVDAVRRSGRGTARTPPPA